MNETAFITGASKRIGKAMAEHLAGNGWNIAVHYNNSETEAGSLLQKLSESYPSQQFKAIRADLSKTEEVENLIALTLSVFGNISLLINNASVFEPGYLKETSSGSWDLFLNINLKAPFLLMRDFANSCLCGNIINIIDTRITINSSDFAAYSLSKKGLWELTKMAALEFAPGIRVNAIAPGVTLAPNDKDEFYLHNLALKTPMKVPGGVEPILKSIDYILDNNHLTGQLLFADGGENLGQNK